MHSLPKRLLLDKLKHCLRDEYFSMMSLGMTRQKTADFITKAFDFVNKEGECNAGSGSDA